MVAIVSRAQWGAAFTIPGGRHVAPSARRWHVVHWPGSAVGGDERAVVRAIERSHRVGQGWQAAPGYNFLVGRSGTIYEGCGRDVRGIHSPPRNTDGWGVCVMVAVGENPPQAALNATRALYNWLNGVAGRTLGMSWHGQHHPTQCAGPALNGWVQRGMPATGGAPGPAPGPGGAPAFPGRILRQPPILRGEDVRTWQNRVRARSDLPNIAADGAYGPISEGACRDVQRIARLAVDGRVGPNTWPATWTTGAGPVGGAPSGQDEQLADIAFWRGPEGGAEETHRVFRREDGRIMYSRNGGAYTMPDPNAWARGSVSITASPSGWLVVPYVNRGGRVCELRSAPGFRPWTWHDVAGPA